MLSDFLSLETSEQIHADRHSVIQGQEGGELSACQVGSLLRKYRCPKQVV